jgi:cytochrome c
MKSIIVAAFAVAITSSMTAVQAQDAAAAEALMKKSGCFKCHSVSAKKDGPSYKSVAEKYKGKADAEASVAKHITTGPMVKIDGKEERHEILKSKDEKEIKNVVSFILSR